MTLPAICIDHYNDHSYLSSATTTAIVPQTDTPSMRASTHKSITTAGIRVPLLLMKPSFFSLLGDDLQILFLSLWLDVRSLSTLDVAVSCHRLRPCWMTLLPCLRSPAVDDWGHSLSSLMWLRECEWIWTLYEYEYVIYC